jgi:glucose uptake protein
MILPHNGTSLVILMLLSMLCLGSWPVFYKLTTRYRFELFYFDFSVGLGILALVCAFTLGSMGFDGFDFSDDLLHARKQTWLFAFLAAVIFNLGNMLMMAAIAVAGMAVAVPLAMSLALAAGAWMSYLGQPAMNTELLVGGTLFMLISIILNSSGYSHLRVLQHEVLARAGKAKSTRRPTSRKGILLALIGGLVMGTFTPLLVRAQDPDDGLGPYSLMFIFAAAVAFSTFGFNLFFMNLPVEGPPLEITEYFKGPIKNHFLGLLGGVVWGIGALASFAAASPKGDNHLSGPPWTMLAPAAAIIAALWGLLAWKELKQGDLRVKAFAALTLVLFAGGVLCLSYASAVK